MRTTVEDRGMSVGTEVDTVRVDTLLCDGAIWAFYDTVIATEGTYVVDYYDKFTHVDTKINKFYQLNETTKANETIKGLIVRYDGKAGTSNASIDISTDANFKAKLIYVDGSERDLSNKTNITIDANNSHADITVSADGKTITVANPSSHSNKVYTLKAKYNNKFETTFELVFERTP